VNYTQRNREAGSALVESNETRVNVRSLSTVDPRALHERYGDALSRKDAARLASAAEARVLALSVPVPTALISLMQQAGVVTARADHCVLLAASRDALERALERAQGDERALVDDALRAFDRAASPPPHLRLRERVLDLHESARVMGILNVTPDSFYERVDGIEGAIEKARAMTAAGAALIDIGGQSYAHWNPRIAADEERERVVPVVRAILETGIDTALSIDTFKASVADAALEAGAHLINDCSSLSDPALPEVVAKHGAGLVVMHLKGELNVRAPEAYVYRDALAEIVDVLYERTERAIAAGVARDAIAIDPGLEFGKEPETDLEILDRFGELTALGYPILFASSRKSFIGRIFQRPAKDLLVPSLATAAIGIAAGARILRVHDVAETAALATMLAAVGPERRRSLAIADRMPGTPTGTAGNSRPSNTV
jgi:dihydropteroate synthase